MKPRLPVLKPKKVLRALQKLGFLIHHIRGSHYYLKRPDKPNLVTVPFHCRDLKRKTLESILKQAQTTIEELLEIL